MSAADDIAAMAALLKGKNTSGYDSLLGEISVALGDIVHVLENPDTRIADAILAGLRGMSIQAPDVQVTVQAPPAALVTVEAPQINMPQIVVQAPDVKGWALTVTGRDGNGYIRTMTVRPE